LNRDVFVEAAFEPFALSSQLASIIACQVSTDLTSHDQSLAPTRNLMDNFIVAIALIGIDQTNCFFYGSSRMLCTYCFQDPDQCSQKCGIAHG
jgi:hypothetical protein